MQVAATPQQAEDSPDHRLARVLDFADELITSMRTIHDQVMAADSAPETKLAVVKEIVATHDQNSRVIRRTLVMREHLVERRRAKFERRAAARRQIIRRVQDAIHAERPESVESLERELYDRLDNPEIEVEIETQDVGEVVEQIEADLGLTYRKLRTIRRTQADIEILHANADQPPAIRFLGGHPQSQDQEPHHDPPR